MADDFTWDGSDGHPSDIFGLDLSDCVSFDFGDQYLEETSSTGNHAPYPGSIEDITLLGFGTREGRDTPGRNQTDTTTEALHLISRSSSGPVKSNNESEGGQNESSEIDTTNTLLTPLNLTSIDEMPRQLAKEDKQRPVRFSAMSVKALRNWMSDHLDNPYPGSQDLRRLQSQTGLTKRQISTWFANARKRTRFQPAQAPLPNTEERIGSLTIPRHPRAPTPAPFEHMNPLQRWEHSPPEVEPADVSSIARAVRESFGLYSTSIKSSGSFLSGEDESVRSFDHGSSIGGSANSRSSQGSVISGSSRGSLGSSLNSPVGASRRRRRRKRQDALQMEGHRTVLVPSRNMFACTFCTDSFKTKYDWRRHEKSMHISLDSWVCSPAGPVAIRPGQVVASCVYCGLESPDEQHLTGHNYAACFGRSSEERTFHRKDHLQQHLRLVHGSKFMPWPMEGWKKEANQIQSRCGFCDAVLFSWEDRVDHLTRHFKREGKTMADWKGDWGFEPHVLEIVENAMPPYLIHLESASPYPFTAAKGSPESPTSAYELLKAEIQYFILDYLDGNGSMPADEELLYQGCCVIFDSDLLIPDELVQRQAEVAAYPLKIAGKATIFQDCLLELHLRNFVQQQKSQNLDLEDESLQKEACSIVENAETLSPAPSNIFKHFLQRAILGSSRWIDPFRARSEALVMDEGLNSLELGPMPLVMPTMRLPSDGSSAPRKTPKPSPGRAKSRPEEQIAGHDDDVWLTSMPFFLSGENSYLRLSKDLSRFVAASVSSHNPKRHVPTDEELRHQARWIVYDDDDPWNQTPADNAVWLREFKRSIGLPTDDGASTGVAGARSEGLV
uniref:Homeobox domain-containing protein n=1 Tax=Bionectria ochroleuca TaxID=29856 RepID=A0A8H7TVW4_BIOOC